MFDLYLSDNQHETSLTTFKSISDHHQFTMFVFSIKGNGQDCGADDGGNDGEDDSEDDGEDDGEGDGDGEDYGDGVDSTYQSRANLYQPIPSHTNQFLYTFLL